MNYRHQFHAGNFADVVKHALLVQLVRAMQKKNKGFLYLDTHAGRGGYDLEASAQGDSLARKPEWPEGIGRLLALTEQSGPVGDYVNLVREFDRQRGNAADTVRYYPGSPWLVRLLARPQDRLALCEKHPDEHAALAAEFAFSPNTTTPQIDGYVAVRAMLPPLDRRALVLIDPPFEAPAEFADVVRAIRDGLVRLSGGVFAVWYPLTERARIDALFGELMTLPLPPTLACEVFVAGLHSPLKMKGCGVVIVNPPWKFDQTAKAILEPLSEFLQQGPGAHSRLDWLVPEK
jgi:23S rRNA (adenine2030-N6)-methyltransferase